MAGANPSDSALFQRMRQQADEAEAETKAQAEREQADADWEALRDPQGRLYYFNAVTRQTAWELPSEVSKAAGLKGKLPPALAPLEKAALATVAAQPAAAASSGGGGGGGGGLGRGSNQARARAIEWRLGLGLGYRVEVRVWVRL